MAWHKDIAAADVEWRPGSEGVEYASFPLDRNDPQSPAVIMSRFAPGAKVAPHTHDTNYFEYIIEGSQRVGKKDFSAGDIRIVEGGTGYGPISVGEDGCTVLIVMQDATRAMMVKLPREKAKDTTPA